MSASKSDRLKFMLDPTIAVTVRDVLLARGWTEVTKEGSDGCWDVYWCDVGTTREALEMCKHGGHQRVPHFRNNSELTTKNMLFRNMKRYKRTLVQNGKTKEAELCDCLPIIFELPAEYLMFVEEYRKSPGNTWIVKPARGSKGRGIFLFQKLKDLMEWREQQRAQCEEQDRFWLIQRYIEKPYLIGGCKFDLRIFVLVTSYQPLRAWMARDGFARIAGSQYSLSSLQDNLVHLTNSALQISAAGDPCRQGCKWSIHKLRHFLTARHGASMVSATFDLMARQVVSSLCSVQSSVVQSNHSFELYGYDILLDEKLTPWLLEVNASPTLLPTSLEDYQLKYNMIEDVFNILDMEHRLTGMELRVGGFDLMWNDGPVYKPFLQNIANAKDVELNSFLGCLNDRDENLKQLQILKMLVSRCTHD
uniref:Tubulin--tyrosine ligase-like protein 9 n=1 Tax=Homalodisca liturata TaxID=320908 RepID=A0A1B6HDY0_9HEMI